MTSDRLSVYRMRSATNGWTALLMLMAFPFGEVTMAQASPSDVPPIPDSFQSMVSQHTELRQGVADNVWLNDDKRAFSGLLTGSNFDWVVVPFQVQHFGFDAAERSMMTAALADALAECQLTVPDPYLVERALGEGQRTYNGAEIDRLSQIVKAKNVIVPFVGHDADNHMVLTFQVYHKLKGEDSIFTTRVMNMTWGGLTYSDTLPPFEVVIEMLPELLKNIRINGCHLSPTQSAAGDIKIPQSLQTLVTGASNDSLKAAVNLAILGELGPTDWRASQRRFERSLLISRRLSDSPERTFLRAYALFRLNLRSAALAVMESHASAALDALRAIINGNVTGTKALVDRSNGYKRLILEFQLNDLNRQYGYEAPPIPAAPLLQLAAQSPAWDALIRRRWNSYESPEYQSNAVLKLILDETFPIKGWSLADLVASHAAVPGKELRSNDVELSVRQHVRRLMSEHHDQWCCNSPGLTINSWDLVDTIEGLSEANLEKLVAVQFLRLGLPDQAKHTLEQLEPIYSGHPAFEVLRAQVDGKLAGNVSDPQRPLFLKSMREHALNALMASSGQTGYAIEALSALTGDPTARDLAQGYGYDWPMNPYWVSNDFVVDIKERLDLYRRALAGSQTGVSFAFQMLVDGGEGERGEVKKAIQDRFLGSPYLPSLMDKLSPSATAADPASAWREKLKAEPGNWANYQSLGNILVAQGKYSEAERIISSFPAFHATAADPVGLANNAAGFGNRFYWEGALIEAKKLYKLATAFHTGSELEMLASMRLCLMNEDFEGALAQAKARAERYADGPAYGDYLSLLYVLGRPAEASLAFDLLLDQQVGPAPWEALMIGQRMAGTTAEELRGWVTQPRIMGAHSGGVPWASAYLMIWNSTDRRADADLPELVSSLAHEPQGVIEGTERVASYPHGPDGERGLVYRSEFRAGARSALKYGDPVYSDNVLYARAMVPFQRGDYQTAALRFDELAARYTMEHHVQDGDAVYALPDFAYASVKSGDPLKLEPFVMALPDSDFIFEHFIAKAYFLAARHDHDGALDYLLRAFKVKQHYIGRHPSTEYQYADAAEKLYLDTHDPRFRKEALRWANAFQRVDPLESWAYAMVAELSEDLMVRRKALVRALFLDRLSPRLHSVAQGDLAYAEAELKKGNPFLLSRSEASRPPMTTTVLPPRDSVRTVLSAGLSAAALD
jgi:tetratricopeptide (TPR) repeat protein